MQTTNFRTPQWPSERIEPETVVWSVFITGIVLDLLTTVLGLRMGLVETNPLAVAVIENYGHMGMIGLKVLIAVGLVVMWKGVEPMLRLFYDDVTTALTRGMILVVPGTAWTLAALNNAVHMVMLLWV